MGWAKRKLFTRWLRSTIREAEEGKRGPMLLRAIRAINGNNRIFALLLIVALSGGAALGLPVDSVKQFTDPVFDWLLPGGTLEGADGHVYTSTDLGLMVYGLFSVGLALYKRKKGLPENPDPATGEESSVVKRRVRMGQRFEP